MFENIIKGGIKPGMVLITDHPVNNLPDHWIVFPNNYGFLYAMNYSGVNYSALRHEGDLLYVGNYQCRAIYEPPTAVLISHERLIWKDNMGVVNDKYKPINTVEDLIEAVESNTTERTNTYFY